MEARNKLRLQVLIGFIGFIILIYAFLSLIDQLEVKQNEKKNWTPKQREQYILNSANEIYSAQPYMLDYKGIVYDFCECCIDSLLSHYSYDEIWNMEDLPLDERERLFNPIIKNCINEYNKRLKPLENELKLKSKIHGCTKRAILTGNIDSLIAVEYCSCFIGYLEEKYSNIEGLDLDSLIRIENRIRIECFNSALNKK